MFFFSFLVVEFCAVVVFFPVDVSLEGVRDVVGMFDRVAIGRQIALHLVDGKAQTRARLFA
jgi:hypothetical protein